MDLGEGPSLFWVKKGKITEGRKARRASKKETGPTLSSRSESATDYDRLGKNVVGNL